MPGSERLATIIFRTSTTRIDEAVAFLNDVLGLPLKFRSGTDWVAFDAGGVTIALEGAGEESPDPCPVLAFKALDLDGAAARVVQQGGVVSQVSLGGHERRVDLGNPLGVSIVLYEPLTSEEM